MKLYHTDLFVLPLPDGHRFPMQRYRLLRERLEASGQFSADEICIPPAATNEQLQRVHTEDWIRRVSSGTLLPDELRKIGFPWSLQMVERCRRSTGATIAASRSALEDGVSANLAGGTHHAFADRGAGYCVFNDVAVAARNMQSEKHIQQALILDGDVHQGDGTAKIFADDPTVRTFSLHAAKAFPARKMKSDLDIELPPGTADEDYLSAWKTGIDRSTENFLPDIIYFLAGADPFVGDTLGGLAISKAGLRRRDDLVFELCRRLQRPLVMVMAGGYASNIDDIVDIQFYSVTSSRQLEWNRSETTDSSRFPIASVGPQRSDAAPLLRSHEVSGRRFDHEDR
ncbi:MAG: histone deacetylase [Planctomycetota bacterium]